MPDCELHRVYYYFTFLGDGMGGGEDEGKGRGDLTTMMWVVD